MKKPNISIIIPAYNVEKYIVTCLDSVLNQTYTDYEIIIINDGSTDDTLKIIKQYKAKYNNIKIINIKNNGQGHARNLGLTKANGKHIMFLDADDFIEPTTLSLTVSKIEKDKSDIVVFDWKYYYDSSKKYKYANKTDIYKYKMLKNEECSKLFGIMHYFSVNKLYLKDFLIKNDIKFGENYIYEDNSFWIKVCIYAKKVSLIHVPLYNVRLNNASTTKTNLNSNKHWEGFLHAIEDSIQDIEKYPDKDYSYLLGYLLKKFVLYYKKRTPSKSKKIFMKKFVDLLNEIFSYNININYNKCTLLAKYILKFKIISKKRLFMLWLLIVASKIRNIFLIPKKILKRIIK